MSATLCFSAHCAGASETSSGTLSIRIFNGYRQLNAAPDDKDIVLCALLMVAWRRNPQKKMLVHSDQGSQYTRQSFLKSHGLEGSMSRRDNCHDNTVAESFFQLLKRERIKKKIYGSREEAHSEIIDYTEMFYTSKRRHGTSDQMPPSEYENQYYQRLGRA